MQTHTFKLCTGIECEVREMTGSHQALLTSQGDKPLTDRLDTLLSECIVRVGTNTKITKEFVKSMLSADRQVALVEIRQFSLDFPKTFDFTYEYLSKDGTKKELPLEVNCNFPKKNYTDGEGNELNLTEYSEVDQYRQYSVVVPRSNEKISLYLLDGVREEMGIGIDKKDRSSHTPLKMRNPRYWHKGENEEVPIQWDLDKAAIKDLETLRKEIKKREGTVDTQIMFEHPEADNKVGQEKNVIVDVLGLTAFFFPSEAI